MGSQDIVTFLVKGLDINNYVGNLIYKTTSYMDETHFTHEDQSLGMVVARRLLKPIEENIFLPSSGKPTASAKMLLRIFQMAFQIDFPLIIVGPSC